MRLRTPLVFGLTVSVLSIAGCGATRQASSDLILLSAGQNASPTTPATPYRQFGRPYQAAAGNPAGKRDDFDFAHQRVDDFVMRFQTDLRGFFSSALSRSARYVPRMSSILEKEGLPQELAYLPLIESGFRPHAVSPAGAVGPWQMIPGTGRRYGLRIDRYVDERRDPVKSTQAAARYLHDLHDMFGDWHLSLAAYNTGEGNISRILERGQAGDFWEMSDQGVLYRETKDYVPEFLAALQIAESPEQYGFEAPTSDAPMRYDLVKVRRSIPLTTIAKLSGTSSSTIQELNPALHRGMIPPNGYSVRVPKGSKEAFVIALANLPVTVPGHARKSKHARRGKGIQRSSGRHTGKVASARNHSSTEARKAARSHKVERAKAGSAPRQHLVARRGHAAVVASRQRNRSRVVD